MLTNKTCSKCREIKSRSDFHKNRSKKDGLYDRCKICVNGAWTVYRQANLERSRSWARKAAKAYRAKNPDKVRANNLRLRFGITPKDFQELLVSQGEVCAICREPETLCRNGKPQSLSVDHDHTSGKVRGLLCNLCNRAVGLLEYQPKAVAGLLAYVESPPPLIPEIEESRSSLPPKERERTSQLKYDFGINISQYKALSGMRASLCWACQEPETRTYGEKLGSLAVDHDHVSGVIRGLLCLSCNRALGAVKNNAARLRALQNYLGSTNQIPNE